MSTYYWMWGNVYGESSSIRRTKQTYCFRIQVNAEFGAGGNAVLDIFHGSEKRFFYMYM